MMVVVKSKCELYPEGSLIQSFHTSPFDSDVMISGSDNSIDGKVLLKCSMLLELSKYTFHA